MRSTLPLVVIASASEAIQICSKTLDDGRFGGPQARRSSHSERRRVVARAPLRKRLAFVAGNGGSVAS